MTEEQKRLEKALLEFIERASKNAATEKEIEALPAAAKALIELWNCDPAKEIMTPDEMAEKFKTIIKGANWD